MISKEQLENLLSFGLPISEIARSLGALRPTVYTFMKEHGIPYQGRFTNHSEENLRNALTSIKRDFPNSGEIMVQGHLRAQGINVQRSRIRATNRDVDPQGVIARQRIHRICEFIVAVSKLSMARGSITFTFGKFSTNNRATTVLEIS